MTKISVADLFCGAGGASSGLTRACRALGLDVELTAINHWPIAIETHSRNHPAASHICASVESVDPRQAVPGGRLHLLVAGPECTHHSTARGGRPINDQSRTSAWHILRWLELLRVDHVIIENVPEFRTWGPIGVNGRPLKRRKGETYQAFLAALRSLGYTVADRVLNAADYGDPTTRRRLFILARRGSKPVTWPTPTHSPDGSQTLFGPTSRWRPARDIIDWSIPGKSIFLRQRPLAAATIARIAAGLRKFGGERFLVCFHGDSNRVHSLAEPIRTLDTSNRFALCDPFILQQQSGGSPRSVSEPLPTIATKGAIALVESFIVPLNHGAKDRRSYSLDKPFPTVTSVDAWALIEPFIASYYGTKNLSTVSDPLPTVTTKDRFALIEPRVDGQRLDIRFRMLQPHELARAMSFEDGYQFAGTREARVRQIGNAWPVRLAEALCRSQLQEYAAGRRERWGLEATA
jgi:DNA (cytosine-5)-methyltransferase 1